MESLVKKVNSIFKFASVADVEAIKSKIILSDRQEIIFNRYYLKKQSINFIADSIGVCSRIVSEELKLIRMKIVSAI